MANIEKLLSKYEKLPLECDGLTKVLHTVLFYEGIPHDVYIGSVSFGEEGIPYHFWIKLTDKRIVDYRARMWLGDKAPNGIFKPSKDIVYKGKKENIKILSPFLYRILTNGMQLPDSMEGVDTLSKLKSISSPKINPVRWSGDRQGQCYIIAGKFVADNRDWNAIHAYIIPPAGPFTGKLYDHAWAEKGNLLYEPVYDKFYKKKDYYDTFKPTKVKSYSADDFVELIIRHKTWGPW